MRTHKLFEAYTIAYAKIYVFVKPCWLYKIKCHYPKEL